MRVKGVICLPSVTRNLTEKQTEWKDSTRAQLEEETLTHLVVRVSGAFAQIWCRTDKDERMSVTGSAKEMNGAMATTIIEELRNRMLEIQ